MSKPLGHIAVKKMHYQTLVQIADKKLHYQTLAEIGNENNSTKLHQRLLKKNIVSNFNSDC